MDKRPSVIARHLAEVHRVGSFFTCPHGACRFKEVPSRRVVFHHLTTHHGVAEKQAAELVAGLEPIVRGEKDAVDYDEAEGTEAAGRDSDESDESDSSDEDEDGDESEGEEWGEGQP